MAAVACSVAWLLHSCLSMPRLGQSCICNVYSIILQAVRQAAFVDDIFIVVTQSVLFIPTRYAVFPMWRPIESPARIWLLLKVIHQIHLLDLGMSSVVAAGLLSF